MPFSLICLRTQKTYSSFSEEGTTALSFGVLSAFNFWACIFVFALEQVAFFSPIIVLFWHVPFSPLPPFFKIGEAS